LLLRKQFIFEPVVLGQVSLGVESKQAITLVLVILWFEIAGLEIATDTVAFAT